jgi:hypothetical protein
MNSQNIHLSFCRTQLTTVSGEYSNIDAFVTEYTNFTVDKVD